MNDQLIDLVHRASKVAKTLSDDEAREIAYGVKTQILSALVAIAKATVRYQLAPQGYVMLLVECRGERRCEAFHIPLTVATDDLKRAAIQQTHETAVQFRARVLRSQAVRRNDPWPSSLGDPDTAPQS